jgi:hypothetical protein
MSCNRKTSGSLEARPEEGMGWMRGPVDFCTVGSSIGFTLQTLSDSQYRLGQRTGKRNSDIPLAPPYLRESARVKPIPRSTVWLRIFEQHVSDCELQRELIATTQESCRFPDRPAVETTSRSRGKRRDKLYNDPPLTQSL